MPGPGSYWFKKGYSLFIKVFSINQVISVVIDYLQSSINQWLGIQSHQTILKTKLTIVYTLK